MSQVYMSEVMDYVDDLDDDFLEHHGILGQRWGIRRFQNKDGSWTTVGLKRRAKLAKLTAGYELSKASVKGSNLAKDFIGKVSKEYSNKKIDVLDIANRSGVLDLIKSVGKNSNDSIYESRKKDVFTDVNRISSYFDESSDRRKEKISDYLKNNSYLYFNKAKDSASDSRKDTIKEIEEYYRSWENNNGEKLITDAKNNAVELFSNHMANISINELSDPNTWESKYVTLGNNYSRQLQLEMMRPDYLDLLIAG